jgi:hypothetical protein
VEEGLVISNKPERKVGGSIATSRVSQAEQIKKVRTRRRELFRRRNSDTSPLDVVKSDISNFKHCASNCKQMIG